MRRWWIVLVIIGALLAGACGGGGDDTVDTKSGDAAGDEKADTDFSGKGSGDFCDDARELTKEFEDQENADTADDLKKQFSEIESAISRLARKAPGEIKGDIETVQNAFEETDEFFAKYDYDASKFPQDGSADKIGFNKPGVEEASDRVESYFEKVCKIDSDEDGDTDGVIDDSGGTTEDTTEEEPTEDETTETTEE